MSAQVAAVPELLENILVHLPPRDIVLVQRVSPIWRNLVRTSPTIKRVLWPVFKPEEILQPYGKKGTNSFPDYRGVDYGGVTESPLFLSIFRSTMLGRWELVFNVDPTNTSALWRGLPVTSPPIADIRIACRSGTGPVELICVNKPAGIRFGDVAEHIAKSTRFTLEGGRPWQPADDKGAEERKLHGSLPGFNTEEWREIHASYRECMISKGRYPIGYTVGE